MKHKIDSIGEAIKIIKSNKDNDIVAMAAKYLLKTYEQTEDDYRVLQHMYDNLLADYNHAEYLRLKDIGKID